MRESSRWRLSAGKKLTFLYVPDDSAVRQFRVPRLAFHAVATAFAVALGLVCYFGTQWVRAAAGGREMLQLRSQNAELRARLTDFDAHLEELDQELSESQEVQQRLRLMANLEPLHPEILEAGVGGPGNDSRNDELISPAVPGELREQMDVAAADLDLLLRRARIQSQSYVEIYSTLQGNQKEWDHTPSVRPIAAGFVSSRFGRRMDPFTGQTAMHRGVDFAALRGSPVRVTAAGVVQKAGRMGGYGLMVEVDHGNGMASRYAHCNQLLVKPGDRVRRGDVIARVGSTGKSTSSHVHYEVLDNGLHQDPLKYVLPTDEVID